MLAQEPLTLVPTPKLSLIQSTMADITLPSSLLQPRDDSEADSLLSILGRIHDERGHFRHITEQGLQAEIAANDNDEESSETDDDEDGADPDGLEEKDRREQLWTARAEMRQHVECVPLRLFIVSKTNY